MCRTRSIQFIGMIVSALMCGQALAQERGNRDIGRSLAQRICSECHAILERQPNSPNPLAPSFNTIANVAGMNSTALTVALQRSHETMPNIILDASELSNVIAYILSLR